MQVSELLTNRFCHIKTQYVILIERDEVDGSVIANIETVRLHQDNILCRRQAGVKDHALPAVG